jgi:Na+/H+-dicarboxylate symporter
MAFTVDTYGIGVPGSFAKLIGCLYFTFGTNSTEAVFPQMLTKLPGNGVATIFVDREGEMEMKTTHKELNSGYTAPPSSQHA